MTPTLLTTQTAQTARKPAAAPSKCKLAAQIRVQGSPPIKCTVTNIRPMGAVLELESGAILPTTFLLLIPEDLFAIDCEIRHRNGNTIGVYFVSDRQGAVARYG